MLLKICITMSEKINLRKKITTRIIFYTLILGYFLRKTKPLLNRTKCQLY